MYVTQATMLNLQITADSGFIFARNRGSTVGNTRTMPMTNDYNMGGYGSGKNDQSKEISDLVNVYGSPNQAVSQNAWTFSPNVPNIITGYYIGNGKNYNVAFKPQTDVPSYCGCYGSPSSDNRIRMFTQSECAILGGRGAASGGECLGGPGGSYSWTCRGLNTQIPCPNEWNLIPGSMLYLIQDPYAPMISFNVIQNYSQYNCDYPFMDKRLSSHKMKWKIYLVYRHLNIRN
jgi:hypothetical protein